MIELKNIRAGYRGREVLHGISLSLREGEAVSLIGPNGCGKTTLLRTACGLLAPMSGEVLFRGRPQREFSRREFARLAAFLPQTRDVPALTVERLTAHGRYPHLAFGRDLSQKDRDAVRLALEETGMWELRDKELSELSGGERQRAYLAMTLAQETDVLFLDEPTTYLDVGQKLEVMELIGRIKDMGKTVVMVLHDLPLAFSYSDQIAVLEQGALRAFGPPDQVFDSGVPGKVFGVTTQRLPVDGRMEYLFSSKR